ncbi:MAG: isochorismate synthase [Coleofasciculaceae cyanobacterium SM2_3_26]|nr:isochorismate synthase [Coleofasciculaceae cyanobacterium SM2_3_26]
MLALPFHATCSVNRPHLERFLNTCQRIAQARQQSQLASISLELPLIDPLTALHILAQPGERHFYWEKQGLGQLAGIGTAIALVVTGEQRFQQARSFARRCLRRSHETGVTHLPFAGMHFCCGFTFFDQPATHSQESPGLFSPTTIWLPAVHIARRDRTCVCTFNLAIDDRTDLNTAIQRVWQVVHQLHVTPAPTSPAVGVGLHRLFDNPVNYQESVASALESIHQQKFRKIVLAHAVDAIAAQPFDPFAALERLRQTHPDCYIFSLGNGSGQSFLGASPERLLRVRDRHMVADALAGSFPRGKTPTEDISLAKALLESDKELREHRFVRDFIVDRLTRLGIHPQVSPVSVLQLSNIQHLWTKIEATLPPHIHMLNILEHLHPTPAVAGVPRDTACREIRRYETFDRALYAAPVGWMDAEGNGDFLVGIRSALIDGNRARLYAGAGIVAGSDPVRELAEIQLKLQAMLKVLL